jgi:carboxyl-terminal processing protease
MLLFTGVSNLLSRRQITGSRQNFGTVLLFLGWLVPFQISAATLDSLDQTSVPESYDKQTRTIKLINYLIEKSHFRNIPLDDKFSEKVLETYVEQLDPAKSFFLQSDIDQFQAIRYEFDDYITEGTVEPAFAIFRIYRSRVNERIEFALDRLEQPFNFSIDEVFELDRKQSNWAQNDSELEQYWRKRIKNDIINLKLANKPEEEIVKTLTRRYTHIARRTRQFNSDDVFQVFINAYVTSIEPHTSYYSPRGAENFKIHMRLSLEGIGAVLQTDNEYTLVRRIIPGGPADLSGMLSPEDRIIGVGQENEEMVDVIGWRLDDVVQLIRGPKSSRVNLEILPGEYGLDGDPATISIVRDKIRLEEQAAKKRVLEVSTAQASSRIGVIHLPSFYSDFEGRNTNDPEYRSTTRDVRRLLVELKNEDINGLIIDLRGNGGGALTEAITLTGLFIRKGPVVQVQNTNGRIQVDRDSDPEIVYDGPLVVLVDRYSASASEIFAGAIQDYQRGLIVGEPTFGKGTVQNLVNLNRFVNTDEDLGQLKVTIAQFFRINGDSTQHRGVIPDLVWSTSEKDVDSGERAYDNALPWRRIDPAKFVPFHTGLDEAALDQAISTHFSRTQHDPEYEYILAVNDINKTNRERNTITLNEEQRRRDRIERDIERLSLTNRKRESMGQSPFANVELLDADEEERIRRAERYELIDVELDTYLVESAKVLVDYKYFTAVLSSCNIAT